VKSREGDERVHYPRECYKKLKDARTYSIKKGGNRRQEFAFFERIEKSVKWAMILKSFILLAKCFNTTRTKKQNRRNETGAQEQVK